MVPQRIEACDVAVVGAGAAGLSTAIFARRLRPALSVTLLEGAAKPGAKILVSGGSRCNVTNAKVADADFWGGRRTIIRRVLRAFPVDQTVAFFRAIGVSLHEEDEGKLFPDSNRSRDVLAALLREAGAAGVRLVTGCRVLDVSRAGAGFRLATPIGDVHAGAVVLATGGRSLPKTGSDGTGYQFAQRLGHGMVTTTPALAPILLDEGAGHRDLSGVSHRAELSVWVDRALFIRLAGSLLWTHFGVSGPVALDASRHWERARAEGHESALTLSVLPGESFDAVETRLIALAGERPNQAVLTVLSTLVPAALAEWLIRCAALVPETPLARLRRDDRRRLAHALVARPLPVRGTRGYNFAEVTAGGVPLDEIDPGTMESRLCPGLFLVGEVLDVDGRLGGFNFQWAWASARQAARALAARSFEG